MALSQSCTDQQLFSSIKSRSLVWSKRMRMTFFCEVVLVAVVAILLTGNLVDGLPFPAPKLADCDRSTGCCPNQANTLPEKFLFQPQLPMRIRRPAHLATPDYITKYRKAYALMKALPDSDPRSFTQQARLHCAYCGNAFLYPNRRYGLEIHGGWFFFPWHRWFLYFHERILASLLGDDTFALPFWNWDNQSPNTPVGNTMPTYFAQNSASNSLYDRKRNTCALPPKIIDLISTGSRQCQRQTDAQKRTANNNIMYAQMTGATNPQLFFGDPYRYPPTRAANGHGYLERTPHGNVHVFTGDPYQFYDDMGNLDTAALDPLFYAHHANLDRLWEVWKAIGDGQPRNEITDTDYTDSEFIFFDENKKLVSVTVGQALYLSSGNLRYKYEDIANPWASPMGTASVVPQVMGVTNWTGIPGSSMKASKCSPLAERDVGRLIAASPQLKKSGTILDLKPVTFRIRRVDPAGGHGRQEMLVFESLNMDWTKSAQIHAFLFHPGATADSLNCLEFFGTFSHIPETNARHKRKDFFASWTLGLTAKLIELGKPHVSHAVVTLVQIGSSQKIAISSPKIVVYK